MVILENFKIGKWGQVLRDGNDKMVLLYDGRPIAFINHQVLNKKRKSHQNDDLGLTIAEFEKMYIWAYSSVNLDDWSIQHITVSN